MAIFYGRRIQKRHMAIREKKHRLPEAYYIGEISVAFAICIKDHAKLFINEKTVNSFTDILKDVVTESDCIAPVYCFMPDHQHLIITGTKRDSYIWKTIVSYKQRAGYWTSVNNVGFKWQKDFYDHVIKTNEDIAAQVRYILDNPVRKGLAASWEEYPFIGSIGCKLEDVLNGIV